MSLLISRPLAIIDLETTGVNVATDKIIEIAIVKLLPDGTTLNKRKFINPQIPIPKPSSDVHGITNEMVKDAPVFKQIANEIKQFLDNCDLGGYNSNRFDIPMLVEEFLRTGLDFSMEGRKLVDVQKIFHSWNKEHLQQPINFIARRSLSMHIAQKQMQWPHSKFYMRRLNATLKSA